MGVILRTHPVCGASLMRRRQPRAERFSNTHLLTDEAKRKKNKTKHLIRAVPSLHLFLLIQLSIEHFPCEGKCGWQERLTVLAQLVSDFDEELLWFYGVFINLHENGQCKTFDHVAAKWIYNRNNSDHIRALVFQRKEACCWRFKKQNFYCAFT